MNWARARQVRALQIAELEPVEVRREHEAVLRRNRDPWMAVQHDLQERRPRTGAPQHDDRSLAARLRHGVNLSTLEAFSRGERCQREEAPGERVFEECVVEEAVYED